jgi:hypothetical protein
MSSNILPMPVAAAVLRGAPIKDHNPEDMRTVIDRVGLIRAAAREATLVHAQPAADMYWLTTDFYDKVSDFPPLRLPFPLMWFEWRMPDRFLNQEGWHDTSAGTARNVFATANEAEPDPANPDPYPDGTYRVVSIDGGWLKDDGTVEILPGILFANINEQGQVLGVVSDGDFFDGLGALGVDDESIEFIAGTLRPAALAVGLMNCKNVHTEQRSTGNVFNRKKRKRSPKLDYHVIVLPSPAGDSEGAGGHRDVRQHKVRGHFKTYTADKPLMGRHVGTYWFAWHLRGAAERGRIIADYKLKRDGM